MKVVYIARTIPHYRERILEELGKLCELTIVTGGSSIGLGGEVSSGHIIKTGVKIWPSPFGRRRLYWQPLWSVLKKEKPDLVISEFGLSLLHIYFLYLIRRVRGFKLTYWTHSLGVELPCRRLTLNERFRLKMLTTADGNFFYTGKCQEVFKKLTVKERSNSWVVWNTLDTIKMNAAWEETANSEALNSKPYVVYLGRLINSKRCGELLDLGRVIKEKSCDLDIVIIGNGDMEVELKTLAQREGLPLIFKGAIIDNEAKAIWLRHSLTTVCFGGIGLNVVDAFGYGSSIIGYAKQGWFSKHGPEVEYIKHTKNGWLMSNFNEIVGKIMHLATDLHELDRVRGNARETFLNECSVMRQIEGFEQGLADLARS